MGVYVPHCLCPADDLSLFTALHADRLLSSSTYRHVVAVLQQVFCMRVAYSIVNLYANGHDWTEYHRDKYRVDGNRLNATGTAADAGAAVAEPHNVTVGASFGAERELRFKHLQTSVEFGFPQLNGDVFAFTEPVNSAFQHSVPRCATAAAAGPRISLILWGRIDRPGGPLAMPTSANQLS